MQPRIARQADGVTGAILFLEGPLSPVGKGGSPGTGALFLHLRWIGSE
jgi:hypothetical protein